MRQSKHWIKSGLIFIGLILLTQLVCYLIEVNWSLLAFEETVENTYFKKHYLSSLKNDLWISYLLALGIKGFNYWRTWQYEPLTIIEKGISIRSKPGNKYALAILTIVLLVFLYHTVKSHTYAEMLLEFLSKSMAVIMPLWAFTNPTTIFYENCFRHMDKVYFDHDMSSVSEGDNRDSDFMTIDFTNLNTPYSLSMPVEHLHTLRSHFKRYITNQQKNDRESLLQWKNRP